MRNLGGMMKKVQEMQGRMEEITREMESSRFQSSVGGGAVVALSLIHISEPTRPY